ncbi:hypothetical protein [Marinobacterium sediminicola]|uniref:DUF1611 domain-containing protein n=1 Tax=Marinobacterium sediminicola TaxID=518898 RepID=A0ABY1RXT7_9GAMM|nr:hypothetical protein [Marinobacterium sediminicola]ULG68578.1 hypothetical protein LN244_12860 [Marinobacterium sediminicola]SMR73096.1 hypothetical protein SAMN04487964_10337 [Marinobacterium sediminicola]
MSDIQNRLQQAKRSFVTRHADLSRCAQLISGLPLSEGDLVLAKVSRRRQHTRIELVNGRRAHLYPGDELILCAGRRYATDQFAAELPDSHEAHLIAAGGIAGREIQRHAQVKPATEITIIGALSDSSGTPLNLKQFASLPPLVPISSSAGPKTLLVTGTGMNSGKTTLAANLIHSLSRGGPRVMACKLTGTGSGPDLWRFLDAGAASAVDFTDAGLASTWQHPVTELVTMAQRFKALAHHEHHDYLIIELADGFFQQETSAVIESACFRKLIDSCFIAADCTPGAILLAQALSRLGISIRGISGTLTRSPLLMDEVAGATGLPVLTSDQMLSFATLNHYLGSLGLQEKAL